MAFQRLILKGRFPKNLFTINTRLYAFIWLSSFLYAFAYNQYEWAVYLRYTPSKKKRLFYFSLNNNFSALSFD